MTASNSTDLLRYPFTADGFSDVLTRSSISRASSSSPSPFPVAVDAAPPRDDEGEPKNRRTSAHVSRYGRSPTLAVADSMSGCLTRRYSRYSDRASPMCAAAVL
jgi:hypothetical protein